jgi:hypothetical protein
MDKFILPQRVKSAKALPVANRRQCLYGRKRPVEQRVRLLQCDRPTDRMQREQRQREHLPDNHEHLQRVDVPGVLDAFAPFAPLPRTGPIAPRRYQSGPLFSSLHQAIPARVPTPVTCASSNGQGVSCCRSPRALFRESFEYVAGDLLSTVPYVRQRTDRQRTNRHKGAPVRPRSAALRGLVARDPGMSLSPSRHRPDPT